MMNTSSLKRRLDRIERAVREREAKKRLFEFTVKELAEKTLWQAVDSILELERFEKTAKLESLLAELDPLDESNCTFREYAVALALKGVIKDCLERVTRKRMFDGAL